jgi:hypothetical protein
MKWESRYNDPKTLRHALDQVRTASLELAEEYLTAILQYSYLEGEGVGLTRANQIATEAFESMKDELKERQEKLQ